MIGFRCLACLNLTFLIISSYAVINLCGLINGLAGGVVHNVVGNDTLDVIMARGFIGQLHKIKTENFTLSLYRIINPLANQSTLNKFPVLYGHGLTFDTMQMIVRSEHTKPRKPVIGQVNLRNSSELNYNNSSDNNMPFLLSNNNFDVWLFDARGTNDNNDKNITSFEENQAFWDFSLDEQGLIDIPLLIDYVLAKTNSKKIVYVGYSETTFFMLALLTTRPEYSEKISACVLMSPITYLGHMKGLGVPLLFAAPSFVPEFLKTNIAPRFMIGLTNFFLKHLCGNKWTIKLVCAPLFRAFGGPSPTGMEKEFFDNLYKTTSMKAVRHFRQLVLSNRFQMYDYGEEENLKIYGTTYPLAYDLTRIQSDRLIIIRGSSDYLSPPEGQERFIRELRIKPYKDIVIQDYNHFDFIDGKNITILINKPVLEAILQLMARDGPNIVKEL